MHRISTDADYLKTGKVVIDADGIPVDVPDRTHVEAADEALGQRIDAEKWRQRGLSSSDNLDDLRGSASQGLYHVNTAVGGGTGLTGWVEVTYDSSSSRTRQVFTASSPAEQVSLERKYSGGSWRDWSPVTWHGVIVSSGSADDLITPHVYAINVSGLAGLPVDTNGSLEVLPAGSGASTLTQIFTSSESTPRTWKRTRRASRWGEWVRWATHQDVEDIATHLIDEQRYVAPTMTMLSRETPLGGGAGVIQSFSTDGKVGYNALTAELRQTLDEGATWQSVRTFGGNYTEWTRMLPNGELMVSTSGTVGGVSGRRVWVSTGYRPEAPTAATWEVVLTPAAPYVKFADWSISITDEMVLMAEYGPKSGMTWGSGTDIIPEGQNARYVYQSLDNGETWSTIFDLNQFLLSNGRDTADRQHLHGVAWDKWWQRIWVSFGDASGNGTNGVLYSDDRGSTWETAYWTHTHPSLGWQVVGIQPMKDCVLFAGDMTPSGVIRLDRAQGKNSFVFETGWDFSETDKHLCHVITYQDGPMGEIALFAFAREGSASPSFILGTRDGFTFEVLWQETGASLPGIRSVAGPSADGTVIASVNTADGWVEVSGRLHVTGSPWVPDGVPAVQKQVDGLVDALEAKADTTYVDDADIDLGSRIDAEKWYRPMLRSGDTLDDKRGSGAVGVYPVTGAVTGTPRNTAGWVEVFYNPDTSSTTQRFFAASWAVSGAWEREHWAGAWREWRDTSMQTAIAEKAPLVHEHTTAEITDLHHYSGTGFPEGKVTAPVGATYTDTAATSGAVRWIKTAGTGNAGWQVEYGDTGWRDVSSALSDVLESGNVFFRRRGDTIDIVAEWAKFIPTGSAQMPAGFRPFRGDTVPLYASAASTTPVAQFRITYNGNLTTHVFDDRYSSNDQGTLITSDSWPTSLPGTPA